MITNGHNGPDEEPQSAPARYFLTAPAEKYLERFAALPPDDPVRGVVNGLEIELSGDDAFRLAWGLESDDRATNKYWIIESDREGGGPVVRLCFESLERNRIRPLDFWEAGP